ncbi:protein PLANT CADMIUM RESISTANCE 2 [Solanum lycopersicum]|uniref:Uncharacterized protein n=1 Tax=Solanum lycopersicum TaxID=4081 RepID=A0A3Q7FZ88_SOLLC|nr:protein PLANT CADMIUM RESISTANCE 2 [Solanum lycopersicum]
MKSSTISLSDRYQKFSSSGDDTPSPIRSKTRFYVDTMDPQPAMYRKKKNDVPWSTGLCDCMSDPKNCCITLWCPCITFGQVAEIIDKGSNSCGVNGALYTIIICVTSCPCIYSCFYRNKMRQQYLLKKSPCGDCLVHCFCEACALCQEYRELKNQGVDMSIGWHGNVERQNRGVIIPPTVEGGMNR